MFNEVKYIVYKNAKKQGPPFWNLGEHLSVTFACQISWLNILIIFFMIFYVLSERAMDVRPHY
jgi:hypothetical protein